MVPHVFGPLVKWCHPCGSQLPWTPHPLLSTWDRAAGGQRSHIGVDTVMPLPWSITKPEFP